MPDPYGNTVIVEIRENEPDGAVTKKSQIDNFMREMKLNLKTFLERSHVAFGDAKAGEPKPGSAAILHDTLANLGLLDPEDLEHRLGYATDRRTLMGWVERGGTPVLEDLTSGGVQSAPSISGTLHNQVLTTSWADMLASVGPNVSMEAVITTGPSASSGLVRARVEGMCTVHNSGVAARGAATKLQYAIDGGAFADINALFTNNPAVARLRGDDAQQLYVWAELPLALGAATRLHKFRMQIRCTDPTDCSTASGTAFSAAGAPRSMLVAVARRSL